MDYSRQAVRRINAMEPKPLFCCVCGDLVDMETSMYLKRGFTKEQCQDIKTRQNADFQRVWANLDERIALVCVCGNHDVGNRPTRASIERFRSDFGDDYLAFWANGTYNIVVNTNLFSDPTGAPELYEKHLVWLEDRLCYGRENKATCMFVFGHHPFFIYNPHETKEDMHGASAPPDECPEEWKKKLSGGVPDSYFPIPLERRKVALALFRKYGVDACFSGHFHQNMVSKTDWGMQMIITSSLSMVFESSGRPKDFNEPCTRGWRIVTVETTHVKDTKEEEEEDGDRGDTTKETQTKFFHRFESL